MREAHLQAVQAMKQRTARFATNDEGSCAG